VRGWTGLEWPTFISTSVTTKKTRPERPIVFSSHPTFLLNQIPVVTFYQRLIKPTTKGAQQPSNHDLTRCLKGMLTLPSSRSDLPDHDALDESPSTSGIPSPREMVLQLLRSSSTFPFPIFIYVSQADQNLTYEIFLKPLTARRVSLHDQSGQKEDILQSC